LAGLVFVLAAVLILVQGAQTRDVRVSTFGANRPIVILDPGHPDAINTPNQSSHITLFFCTN